MGRQCICCGKKGDCDARLCRSLSGDGSIYDNCKDLGIPEEAKNNSFDKIKYTLSGFKDWSYEGSYSGFFNAAYQSNFVNRSKGTATIDFKISISNLNIFNRDYIFEKTDTICSNCCSPSVISSFKKPPCAFSSNEEYIGEIQISSTIGLSSISGKVYEPNIWVELLQVSYGDFCNAYDRNTSPACRFGRLPTDPQRYFVGSFTNDLLGSVTTNYKFDIYLIPSSMHPNNCSSCFRVFDGMQPLSFACILKEAKIDTSGVYDLYGYERIKTDTICNCHPDVCNIRVPTDSQYNPQWRCEVTNCEKKIINTYAECKKFINIFSGSYTGQPQRSDISQKFFETSYILNGQNIKCKGVYIPNHTNHKNISPIRNPIFMLINAPNCENNFGLLMKINPSFYKDPCLQWDDASKKCKVEYFNVCDENLTQRDLQISFSDYVQFLIGQYSDINYSEHTLSCFASNERKNICDNNNNKGFLMEGFNYYAELPSVLNYVMNLGYTNSLLKLCDSNSYTEDKIDPDLKSDRKYYNYVIPVPPLYNNGFIWTDVEAQYSFTVKNDWQQYPECNDFSRLFGIDSWTPLDPPVISVQDTNNAQLIQPAFILPKPLNIKMEITYE